MLDDEGKGTGFKPCTHTFVAREFPNDRTSHLFRLSCDSNVMQRRLTAADIISLGDLAAIPVVDMDAYADQALAYMLPTLNQGVSLINFIHELKDLKSWSRGGSAVARVRGERLNRQGRPVKGSSGVGELPYSDMMYRLPGGRGKMLKSITKRLTGAHLEASFGIVPFFADLIKTTDSVMSLAYRLEILKRNSNRRLVRHYRKVLPDSSGEPTSRGWRELKAPVTRLWPTPYDSDTVGSARPSGTFRFKARWIQRPVYHATIRYSYSLPSMREGEEKLWTLLDTLGVRLDPSIVWNAIPYSFIVDWIADVSGFLQTFARDNFPIETHVVDFCHSLAYHSEAVIDCSYSCDSVSSYTASGQNLFWGDHLRQRYVQLYKQSMKSYNRVRASPDIHSIATRAPTLRQAALSGSLLVNKSLGGHGRPRG
jgi:hypothetical protein